MFTVADTAEYESKHVEEVMAQCQSVRKAVTASENQTVTSRGDNFYMLHQSEFLQQQSFLSVQYGPPSDLSEVPAILWAKHKNHVGLGKACSGSLTKTHS